MGWAFSAASVFRPQMPSTIQTTRVTITLVAQRHRYAYICTFNMHEQRCVLAACIHSHFRSRILVESKTARLSHSVVVSVAFERPSPTKPQHVRYATEPTVNISSVFVHRHHRQHHSLDCIHSHVGASGVRPRSRVKLVHDDAATVVAITAICGGSMFKNGCMPAVRVNGCVCLCSM